MHHPSLQQAANNPSASRKGALLVAVASGLALVALLGWSKSQSSAQLLSSSAQPPAKLSVVAPTASHDSAKLLTDEQRMVGRWQDEFYGVRTFEFQNNNQGTMKLELDRVGQYLYGKEVLFNFEWKLEGQALHLTMTGGSPSEKTEMLGKIFGTKFLYKLVSVDESELQIQSDSKSSYTLKRLPATASEG